MCRCSLLGLRFYTMCGPTASLHVGKVRAAGSYGADKTRLTAVKIFARLTNGFVKETFFLSIHTLPDAFCDAFCDAFGDDFDGLYFSAVHMSSRDSLSVLLSAAQAVMELEISDGAALRGMRRRKKI